MSEKTIDNILNNWQKEFKSVLLNNQFLCIALFKTDGELEYANDSMKKYLGDNPLKSFINPSFESLKAKLNENNHFSGYITFGDFFAFSSSLKVDVYKRKNSILLIGGVESEQLMVENKTMLEINKEINRLQRDLHKERLNLEKSNSDKDIFMSVIAHDLRSPFNGLLGMSNMLIDNINDFDKEFIKEQLKIINRSAQSAYALLEDLLFWSRSQSGIITFNIDNVNIYKVVEEMLQDFNTRCSEKNIEIINECEVDTLVKADLNMLRTILRNLLSNAIKFTPNGSDVKVQSEKINQKVKISIIDSGVGISYENIKKILAGNELFSTYGTNNEKGTGLGLKICKQFIKNHNSELEIESELGKGSEFSFMLAVSNK